MSIIQDTLRPLGITCCYKGYNHTIYAIELAVKDDTCLEAVVKEVYMKTASHFKCKWTSVERNIRTVVLRAWKTDSNLMCQMAGYNLSAPPAASEFIAIISSYIQRSQL